VLLDTHAFLWATLDSPRLSTRARELLDDVSNELLLSAASAAEIAMKVRRGKLELPEDPGRWFHMRRLAFGAREVPITIDHALAAGALPRFHADPFDRILIAQAQAESVPILSADTMLQRYEVEILW
jgi:PIN domain nuclease of toxin-antitoxin system